MKKLFLTFSFIFALSIATNAGCYEFWIEDYDAAEAEYFSDRKFCFGLRQGSRLLNMCLEEAERSFDYNIHKAGTEFYRCTFR